MAKPIITSILDLDLYKLTVQQIAFNRFANIEAEYEFTCRNKDKVELLRYVSEEALREQVYEHLPKLALTNDEYEFLASRGYFQETYLQFLLNFRLNPTKHVTIVKVKDGYKITARGPWASVKMYETLILCIVTELYEKEYMKQNGISNEQMYTTGFAKLEDKIQMLLAYNKECRRDGFEVPKFIEFGTRRRMSRHWQMCVLDELRHELPDNIVGTSNVRLAHLFNMREIGTFGHEFPMVMQGVYPVQKSQRMAARIWLQEYNGLWGTFLGDTLGDDKFFKDFTFDLAKGYDGIRHDSGCPFEYGERVIKMYEGYGIAPLTKKLVFSDGLDFETMIELHKRFRGRIQVLFGIGTNLTNDVGLPVLQNVMKATMSNGQDVAKLSNNPSKVSCNNPLYVEYLRMACERY